MRGGTPDAETPLGSGVSGSTRGVRAFTPLLPTCVPLSSTGSTSDWIPGERARGESLPGRAGVSR